MNAPLEPPELVVNQDDEGDQYQDVDDDNNHDENSSDGSDSDDSTSSSVFIEADGFHDAVSALEDVNDRLRPIDGLYIHRVQQDLDQDEDEPEFEDDGILSFRRFVTLLGRGPNDDEGGGGRRAVRNVDLNTDWRGCPGTDMERLFRDVLPNHPTLTSVGIRIGELPAGYLRLLTDAIPTEPGAWPLSTLQLHDYGSGAQLYPDDFEGNLQVIVEMLNRDVALSVLAFDMQLEADPCRRICQAFPRSTHVQELFLSLRDVAATEALDGALATPPSLRQLSFRGPFSVEALRSLSRQLRTNTTLEGLNVWSVGPNADDDPQPLLELVQTYNYTLRRMDIFVGLGEYAARGQELFTALMVRNEHIRTVLQHLQQPSHTVSPAVLALVLGVVSDFPTLVQRFVKQYYVYVVTERLARGGAGDGTGRRGRRRIDDLASAQAVVDRRAPGAGDR